MRRAWAIWRRDVEDAIRNSTFLLVLIGPVVCSVLFFRVSATDDFAKPSLGLVGSRTEGIGLILATSNAVKLSSFRTVDTGREALEKGKVDGVLEIPANLSADIMDNQFPVLALTVQEAKSLRTSLLTKVIEEAARTIARQDLPIDLVVNGATAPGNEEEDWSKGMLPNWLVFTAMSGLMVCSASFIEEKEQRTLLGVLTAPVSMVELWVGKVGAGFTLAFVSTLAVLLGNSILPSSLLLLHLIAGCLSFSALGILVGIICTNQSAANAATSTLFMVIYIPLALQELSTVLNRAATFSPAFYLQRGSRFFMAGQVENGLIDLGVLIVFFLAFSVLSLWLARSSKRILPNH